MSFWNLNDGTTAQGNSEYEIESGNLEPIPDDTQCIAAIEEAKWDQYEADHYISLKWKIIQPDQYARRVIYQKLKVFGTSRDKDPAATADKAKRMLAAIDTNAGGKLMKLGTEPDDTDLMSALVGKMMAIKVKVWEMTSNDGKERSGNWICAVAPAKGVKPQGQSRAPAPSRAPAAAAPAAQQYSEEPDFDVPF